jgi:hypothetical protein
MARFLGGMAGGVKPPLPTPATTVRVKIETSIWIGGPPQKAVPTKANQKQTQ